MQKKPTAGWGGKVGGQLTQIVLPPDNRGVVLTPHPTTSPHVGHRFVVVGGRRDGAVTDSSVRRHYLPILREKSLVFNHNITTLHVGHRFVVVGGRRDGAVMDSSVRRHYSLPILRKKSLDVTPKHPTGALL
ncbi:hypothetical protein Bbelb_152520 [Branchiostoma belcheri]|nr:hypothetical protein Bbelb_152520 [Branchiostoma belcheri]